jgi:hypothetical protein
MGERGATYRLLVGKLEEKRPLGKSKRRCEDNNKMELREGGWRLMDWTDLTKNRDRRRVPLDAVMNFRVPYIAQNLLTGWEPVKFPKRTLLHGVTK